LRVIGTLVIVPNIAFLMAMPFYVAVRPISPFFYLVAGTAAYFLPAWCAFPLFLLAASLDLAQVAMLAFHLPFSAALDTLRFLVTIDISASAFYIGLMAMQAAMAVLLAWLYNRHRQDMPVAAPSMVLLAAIAISALDLFVNPVLPKTPPPFDSATSQNGMTAESLSASGHNVLLVIVEGLGAYADPAERSHLSEILQAQAATGRYALTSGTTRFSGSTTGAAARELCGHWGSYLDFLSNQAFDCLPQRLRQQGFETKSYHGYTRTMFFRHHWYPQIGFHTSAFIEDMTADSPQRVPSRCGSVFKGLCDTEIAAVIHTELKADPQQRKFLYFLTLNTHIPYVPSREDRLGCAKTAPAIENRTVCDLTNLWSDLFTAIATIAADPDLPPTDILIVGDHTTPLWERAARRHFIPGLVDWYRLQSLQPARERLQVPANG
jgi:hypothetical protein